MKKALLFAALPSFLAPFVAHAAGLVPVAEAVAPTAVVASSTFSPHQSSEKLTDGSGLSGDRHDNDGSARTMWHTPDKPAATSPATGLPTAPAWVRFDFSEPRKIDEIRIWNHNQDGYTDRGFRKTRLYGTSDGSTWFKLTKTDFVELPRGGDTPTTLPVRADRALKAVILAAENNHGSACYGLSEVKFAEVKQVAEDAAPFPATMECKPESVYRHRADGKAGREITVSFSGGKLYGEAEVEVAVSGMPAETFRLPAQAQGRASAQVLLPEGAGVECAAQAFITFRHGAKSLSQRVEVPAKRQWTVYVYPHSHVDIGYTNTQANVELIHKHNLLVGIELAKKTADWPEGSRYVWNPEVTWPIERYLATATPAERETVLDAIRKGWIAVDAGYINDNTSVACDEEMFPFMAYANKLRAETGVKVDTLMQVDVPGMSWGVVPVAAANGLRYIMAFHNGADRTGNTNDLNHRPVWWEGPDGKSRVLYLQPGSYVPGASIKGHAYWPSMMGQTDPARLRQLLDSVKTANPRANFCDRHFMPMTNALEKNPDYPYDLFVMSWAMADNTPVDQDLPEGVRSWNAEYAYPHIVIAGTHTIMSAFEKKYGDKIPVMRGDLTEYWTDGLGTAAKQTGMNRATKERIIQADTLGAMLSPGKPAPRADFDEAWRYVVLGSEHTWAFSDPNRQPIQDTIMKVKFGYFDEAKKRGESVLAGSLAPVSAQGGAQVAVFNTLSWARDGLATLSSEQSKSGDAVKDESGAPVPSQRLATGELVFASGAIPAFGGKNYTLSSGAPASPANPVKVAGLTLDNGLVKVTLDETTGDIASLVMSGREFVDTKAPCRLNSYRYLHGGDGASRATGPTGVKISVKEKGPLVASLLVESKAEGCNKLVREVRLTAGSAEVACDDLVDKVAITAKEGVHFGFAFDLPGARTRMDIPWGVAEVEKDQLAAGNRNWICFQRWLDVSNDRAGVVWSALDAPTFEYGDITANIIGGANGSPLWKRKLEPSSTIYSWALNNHWHTNFPLSQSGLIPFRYRLLPHAGGFDAAAANRFGTAQSQPLVATPVKAKVTVAPQVQIDNPRVQITILRSEAGGKTLLRVRSLSEKEETAKLTFPNGRVETVVLGPYGMKSL